MLERPTEPETTLSERFAAHWVSPHGSVRVFLGVGRNRHEARRVARAAVNLRGLGLVRRSRIEVTNGRSAVRSPPAGSPGNRGDAIAIARGALP